MKNLTDFRKTVETGVDPRLPCEQLLAFVKSLFAPWLVSHVLLQKPKRSQKETFASRVITSANTVVKYQQGHGSLLNLRNDWL